MPSRTDKSSKKSRLSLSTGSRKKSAGKSKNGTTPGAGAKRKTKEQLIRELETLSRRNSELEEALECMMSQSAGSGRRKADSAARGMTEEALRLKEAQKLAHVGDWEWDIATNRVYWSEELYRIYGFAPYEIEPDYGLVLEAMHPGSKEEFLESIDSALKGERPFEMDYTFLRQDGYAAILHTIGRVIRDAKGNPERMVGIVQDITGQKKAEQELRESEERFRTIFDKANDGMLIADFTTRKFVAGNAAISGMTGYTKKEIEALGIEDIHPPLVRPRVMREFEKQMRGEKIVAENLPVMRKDGSIFHADISAAPLTLGGVKYALGIFRDITERNKAEEALKESEARFRRLFEESPVSLWLEDFSAIEEYFEGVGLEGVDSVRTYLDEHPEVVSQCTALIKVLDVNQATLDLYKANTKDELFRSMHKIFTKESLPTFKEAVIAILEGKRDFDMEGVNQKLTGERLDINVKWTIPSMYEKTSRVIVSIVDVTERKKAEGELLRMKQLESLGMVAAGIAHDFNNLLQGILGNVSLAKLHMQPGEMPYRLLDEAEAVYSSARQLTGQLLTFSKGGEPLKNTFDIGSLIKDWTRFMLSGSNIACDLLIPDARCLVEADEAQVRQVIQNLILNAKEAMPSGGTITVRMDRTSAERAGSSSPVKGNYIRITVSDEGTGIAKDFLDRIFDPYFSTKNSGKQKGMGLGLTICHSIIKRHRGYITVESKVGEGSTFQVFLPVPSGDAVAGASEYKKPEIIHERRKVLFMDDEKSVSEVARDYLEFRGFEVVLTRECGETVRAFRDALDAGAPFDAVVLDLTIPGGCGGVEAVRELLAMDPGVRAIISSGYSDDPSIRDFEAYGFKSALTKPYKMEALHDALSEIIEGG